MITFALAHVHRDELERATLRDSFQRQTYVERRSSFKKWIMNVLIRETSFPVYRDIYEPRHVLYGAKIND